MTTPFSPASLDDSTTNPAWPPVELLSVNVAEPRVIGRLRSGEPVVSGIAKRPVTTEYLALDALNLEGDRQADLSVHGGPDKAVYAYPSEHFPLWNAELGSHPIVGPATFGENLTTRGWVEADVCIGDVWGWGSALLQVTQPRSPCYKLALITGRPDLLKRLTRSGRTGWYLRVLQPGEVPVTGPIHVVSRDPARVSVLDAHRALEPATSDAEIQRVLSVGALAQAWRDWLLEY